MYDYDQISIEFYSEKSYIKGVGSCGNKFIVTGFLDDDNQNICLDLDTVGSNERYYYKNVYMFMTELFPILEKIKEMYNKSKCIY